VTKLLALIILLAAAASAIARWDRVLKAAGAQPN